MTRKTPNKLVGQIDRLLEEERLALSEGRLNDLVELISQKQALIDALTATPLAQDAPLKELQSKAARNQAMLDSALRGIKSVSARLSTLRKVRESLDSYDAQGQRRTINTPSQGKLEKRA